MVHRSPGLERRSNLDACVTAAVIEPEILQIQPMHVDIELTGSLTRGRTVATSPDTIN